ncbi:MAG: signal recognition particle-docking protein FtsY [Candidatus Micrarchaeota archaeon]
MFDFLKKKIKDFVGTITRKEETAAEEQKLEGQPLEKEIPVEKPAEQQKAEGAAMEIAREPEPTEPLAVLEKKISEPVEPPKEKPVETLKEEAAEAILEEVETAESIELGKIVKEEPAPEKEITGKDIAAEKEIPIEKLKPKIASIPQVKTEKIIEVAVRTAPVQPEQIAEERRKLEEKVLVEEIQKESQGEDKEEKEIEELVGGTVEGEIKAEAKAAERKIVDDKRKEEIAKKVFTKEKEEFLAGGKEREMKPKVGLFSQIKGLFTGEVEIKESDTGELFKQFEMALLESDVSFLTAQALITDLKNRLVGRRVKTGKIGEEVKKEIAFALASVLQTSKSNFYDKIAAAKEQNQLPYVVLFIGPNGMGKTTTIAKIGHNLKERGLSAVISASDTFRAAAIEQAEHHGSKLGIKVIKHKYGADPAAVAFDAIKHAKAHGIDIVLIDTAGRQDTNLNLLHEMQKIVRVVKPNLKVFIAEAIAGTSLVNQVKTFHEKLGVDGIVLTKLDCDAKGGGTLSIAYECKLPVYFVGTGQEYDDLLEFNEEWIVKNIMAE